MMLLFAATVAYGTFITSFLRLLVMVRKLFVLRINLLNGKCFQFAFQAIMM